MNTSAAHSVALCREEEGRKVFRQWEHGYCGAASESFRRGIALPLRWSSFHADWTPGLSVEIHPHHVQAR